MVGSRTKAAKKSKAAAKRIRQSNLKLRKQVRSSPF